jgi:hypothetical protein
MTQPSVAPWVGIKLPRSITISSICYIYIFTCKRAMTLFTEKANEGKLNNVIQLNDDVGYTD